MGSIAGAVVTLVLGVALTRAMGIDGALMGMILTGAAVTVVYGLAYRRGARAHATIASASKEQPLDESGIRTVGNEQGLEARGIIVTRARRPCHNYAPRFQALFVSDRSNSAFIEPLLLRCTGECRVRPRAPAVGEPIYDCHGRAGQDHSHQRTVDTHRAR